MFDDSIVPGWEEDVCIECKSEAQVVQYDNYKVKQNPSICLTSLSVKDPNAKEQFDFMTHSQSSFKIDNIDQILFDNTEPINCPVDRCNLLSAGC